MEINAQNYALYEMTKKSIPLAYLIGFFFGALGLHMLYLRQHGHALFRFMLFLFSIVIPELWIISMIVYLIDGFWTYNMAESYNNNLKVMYGIKTHI